MRVLSLRALLVLVLGAMAVSPATAPLSGTAIASPHVAGVAAPRLQGNPTASPAVVTSAIVNTAFTSGSPNRLLNSLLVTPLNVSVFCQNIWGDTFSCDAYVSGGSGTGYTFEWHHVDSSWDDPGGLISYATGYCYNWSRLLTPWVRVTDSTGAWAYSYTGNYCEA